MTRSEALHRLRGTWRFESNAGRVAVRDVRLCATIDEERDRGTDGGPGEAATPTRRPTSSLGGEAYAA